jgi:CheY-like chemotaxis protein
MKTPFTRSGVTNRARWIVVDDDADTLSVIQAVLVEFSNVDIQYFSSPHAAFAAFAANPDAFSFITTDLEMPDMSGIELCDRLRKLSPSLKVLLVTGSGVLTDGEVAQMGFCGLVRKPFLLTSLRRALVAAGACGRRMENNLHHLRP